jgi:hypothetical protein
MPANAGIGVFEAFQACLEKAEKIPMRVSDCVSKLKKKGYSRDEESENTLILSGKICVTKVQLIIKTFII